MEFLIAALIFIGAAALSVLLNLFSSELYDSSPSLARWLIDCAVAKLPECERERRLEEWLADQEAWSGGNLGRLRHALGCYIGVRALANALTKQRVQHALVDPDVSERERLEAISSKSHHDIQPLLYVSSKSGDFVQLAQLKETLSRLREGDKKFVYPRIQEWLEKVNPDDFNEHAALLDWLDSFKKR
jgi:hypothetical protein